MGIHIIIGINSTSPRPNIGAWLTDTLMFSLKQDKTGLARLMKEVEDGLRRAARWKKKKGKRRKTAALGALTVVTLNQMLDLSI